MKLVYMGSADFAIPALEALADSVALVVSQPDSPAGRGMTKRPTPVKTRALELGLPVETPEKSRDPEFVERIRSLEADALVVAAYGQILSPAMLAAAKRGGINLHGSLLPRYRGAAPIQRAIEAGELFTGVTLMQMDKGMDTGDIIASELVSIGPDETAGELFGRLASAAADLAAGWLPQIAAGDYPRTPQNGEEATLAPKVLKEHAKLEPEGGAIGMYNRFRAFTPFPGAYFATRFGALKVTKARLVLGLRTRPGVIISAKPDLVLGLKEGALRLDEVQPEGRRAMSGADFVNGARLGPGDSLF